MSNMHTGYRQQLKLTASKSRHRYLGQMLAYAEALPDAQCTPDPWIALEGAAVAFIPSAAMPGCQPRPKYRYNT